ncbi:MAG: hypothetical protein EA416_14240 [Trueperaceae bacterium]|nr:MAG: hypothetical protein EA416_14240 [Trueperaceae bacterium]
MSDLIGWVMTPRPATARSSGRPVARPGFVARLLSLALVGGLAFGQTATDLVDPPSAAWPQHGRTPDGQRFSPLSHIDVTNVDRLRLVWSQELGEPAGHLSPAVWESTLVVSIPDGLVALDAATGETRWTYRAETATGAGAVALPERAPRGAPVIMHGRVYTALRDPIVVAVDFVDGSEVWRTDVGLEGLAEGFSSNPIAAGESIVVGPSNADFGAAPGRIVAIDPNDGSVRWTFFLVPQEESDPAHSTWQPMAPTWRWGIGGASAWNVGVFDPVTRTVLYGTGQPVPSERLDQRRRNDGDASADHYSSGFVALDADTGALRWFHQVVPGDEWEYDQHTVPVVVDLETDDGTPRRAALLATTTGFLVAVDMTDGAIVDTHQLAPDSNVHLGYDAGGRAIIDASMRHLGEREATQVCPGSRWANVAPGAYSPLTGLLYRPNDTVCERQGLRPSVHEDAADDFGNVWMHARPRQGEDYYERWGALSAIDPISGAVVWEFASEYPHDAGVLATAGGLVFSVFADRVFRAFDAGTGAVLFEQVLTSHGDGSPITYEVDGTQYVAVIVGHASGVEGIPGTGLPRSVSGPAVLFVFALDGP